MSCVCHAFASVHSCLVVTGWERADLLALDCDGNCVFVTFLCGILGQVYRFLIFVAFLTFLSNTGPGPLNITKLPSQHIMLGHNQHASVSLAGHNRHANSGI